MLCKNLSYTWLKSSIDVSLRISLKYNNLNIVLINVHAQTENEGYEEKKDFYETGRDIQYNFGKYKNCNRRYEYKNRKRKNIPKSGRGTQPPLTLEQ